MNYLLSAITLMLIISCSQKNLVQEYQKRIAQSYSYSKNRVLIKKVSSFVNVEQEQLNICKRNREFDTNCYKKYYQIVTKNHPKKLEQIKSIAAILYGDLEHYNQVITKLQTKIDKLKTTPVSANQRYFQTLINTLTLDLYYYKQAVLVFSDYIDNIESSYLSYYNETLSFIHSIELSDKNIATYEKKSLGGLNKNPINQDKLEVYRTFIQRLNLLTQNKTESLESSRKYSNKLYSLPQKTKKLYDRLTKKSKLTTNMSSLYSYDEYHQLITTTWQTIDKILYRNKPMTHLSLTHINYNEPSKSLVNYIPISSSCLKVKSSSFSEINMPWTSKHINSIYQSTGSLKKGINCQLTQLENRSLASHNQPGVAYDQKNKQLNIFYYNSKVQPNRYIVPNPHLISKTIEEL